MELFLLGKKITVKNAKDRHKIKLVETFRS